MAAIPVSWPNGHETMVEIGQDWLEAANAAGITIPTGCMGGSCGACEIDVNGKTVRACISSVQGAKSGQLCVEFSTDPFW